MASNSYAKEVVVDDEFEDSYEAIKEHERQNIDYIKPVKENIYESPEYFRANQPTQRGREWWSVRQYDLKLIIFAIIATLQIIAIIVLIYLLNAHVKETNEGFNTVSYSGNEKQLKAEKVAANTDLSSKWVQQTPKVCFGAQKGKFGSFVMTQDGVLLGLKLDYLSGYLTCVKNKKDYKSNFGCRGPINSYYNENMIGVVVTDNLNNIIFPKSAHKTKGFYSLPGYNAMGNQLAFTDYNSPIYATKGMQLRIWYLEDLIDYTDDENDGIVCVKVSAKLE